jgi:predicted dienelactone hydrolase
MTKPDGTQRPIALVASILLLCTVTTRGHAEQFVVLDGLRVAVWMSDPTAAGRRPLIIFSHGFHGCATQSRFLMEALARHGYAVFAPNHRDATCAGGHEQWTDPPEATFFRPDQWTEATWRDRAEDIRRLLEALGRDNRFRDRIDRDRIGLAGHSLGGYTVLGLGGAWPAWRMPAVRAVLAMSPYSLPFIVRRTLGGLAAPVMYQGGTWDFGITPFMRMNQGAYDLSPSPKYYVELAGAWHLSWTDLPNPAHEPIVAYAAAFFDYYVKGTNRPVTSIGTTAGVAEFRYEVNSAAGHGNVGGDRTR